MRPDVFTQLLSFDEGLATALAHARAVERTETVSLDAARGRIAAATVTSAADVPAFSRAAMDGYAVRTEDVRSASATSPVRLIIVDRIFTGRVSQRTIGAGECAEIATGAPLPAGADAVVMVEHTSTEAAHALIRTSATAGQNVGRQGSDLAAGSVALGRNAFISPARLGALAAVGLTTVEVFAKPRVAIVSTGNEITAPGQRLRPGHVYDVNRFTLQAVVEQHGGTVAALPPAEDTIEALTAALSTAAATHDLVVCSGGSSVGGRDLLVDVMQRVGVIHFHGLAIKPGKPTLFGAIGHTPLFGMPGNPTSCLSNAYLLLVPFVRLMAQLPPRRPVQVTLPLAQRITSPSNRHQFFAVRVEDQSVHAAFKSSSDITSLANADGYIEIEANVTAIEAGALVTVTYF